MPRLGLRVAIVGGMGLALLAVFLAAPSGPAVGAEASAELLPDLQTQEGWLNGHLRLDVQHQRYRRWIRRYLRLDNEVVNLGSGPLELYPLSEDCDGDGKRRNDRTAMQRVYHDANDNGTFQRELDTAYTDYVVGCMVHHHRHQHWHFEGFAVYELYEIAQDGLRTGEVLRSSDKVSFCIIDIHRHAGGDSAYYNGCGRNAVQGLTP